MCYLYAEYIQNFRFGLDLRLSHLFTILYVLLSYHITGSIYFSHCKDMLSNTQQMYYLKNSTRHCRCGQRCPWWGEIYNLSFQLPHPLPFPSTIHGFYFSGKNIIYHLLTTSMIDKWLMWLTFQYANWSDPNNSRSIVTLAGTGTLTLLDAICCWLLHWSEISVHPFPCRFSFS